jgi:hypothetical protein
MIRETPRRSQVTLPMSLESNEAPLQRGHMQILASWRANPLHNSPDSKDSPLHVLVFFTNIFGWGKERLDG